MDELGSIWFYQESIDELRQKLQYTSFELEALKMKANEQTRKHKEEIKNLLDLLKIAYQERDYAKEQLQKLLNKLTPSISPLEPTKAPPRANSSITESNSFSHGSSPVDSFFDAVSSPELSNINSISEPGYKMGFGNQPLYVQDCNGRMNQIDQTDVQTFPQKGLNDQVGFGNQLFVQNCDVLQTTKNDPADALIDGLLRGKSLPQKGRLLQAVMESGPLLQTLLVAGPLPRWRNPPPLQPFKVPPVSIKGCDSAPKLAVALNSLPCHEISRGYSNNSQMCSASLLNFAGCPVSGINTQIPVAKRQRFQ